MLFRSHKLDDKNINYIIDNNNIFYKSNYSFNNFINLRTLILSNDRFINDNNIKFLYNLETLILTKNKLLTDNSLKNLNNIKVLELNYNKNISNLSLINKKNLVKLKLIHNKKINDEAFINIKKLEYLHLGYNNNRKLKLEFLKNNQLKTLILLKKKKYQMR